MRVTLFGKAAESLDAAIGAQAALTRVDTDPEVVVCYGGDGTLLSAELAWPYIPKVPIRNSRRGHRMMGHPPNEIIARLAEGKLVTNLYMKLEGRIIRNGGQTEAPLTAMNELNLHMSHINAAVRYEIDIDDEPYGKGMELIGDGCVISTPFGSTAYFRQITRGIFHVGLGIAFKFIGEQTNHIVVPEEARIRIRITRGPVLLAHDNAPEYETLNTGDELKVCKSSHPAVLLTWDPMKYPSDNFTS